MLQKWARIALILVFLTPVSGAAPRISALILADAGTIAVTLLTPPDSLARGRSSSGYSRSGSGFSFSSRRPSFGGGYTRPRTPAFDRGSGSSSSASDRAVESAMSSRALNDYRRRTRTDVSGETPSSRRNSFAGSSSASPFSSWGRTPSSRWYASRGWAPPIWAYGGPPRFGIWNAFFLWFMLDHLTAPGHAAFFYNHQNDPGYQEWRAEAERQAADNADLRARLDRLDQDLAQRQGQPIDPDYMPSDIPAADAVATDEDDQSPGGKGSGALWLALPLGVLLFLLVRSRRRAAGGGAPSSPTGRDSPMTGPLHMAGNILRGKFSKDAYSPSLFHVGMTLTVDPAPFILAAGHTKVTPPDAGNNRLLSVDAVGTRSSGGVALHRLYLPGFAAFFQIHLDRNGVPDECRYFTVIDTVHPADAGDWGFWLDRDEGLIGWPEFQTKDGKIYSRLWGAGTRRVPPQDFTETVKTARGDASASSEAMLYGAPTGAGKPAPETEYILVEAVEQSGKAWIQIAAGIDVNPASLSLS